MEIKTKTVGHVVILRLSGRFDAHEADKFLKMLLPAADQPDVDVIVNLEAVPFVDSTALATLVQGMKHSRENDSDLILCNLQQPVRIIFELTRFDKAFQILDSEAAALAAAES